MSAHITLVPSSQIDRELWNHAVSNMPIYCRYDYLHVMCDNWSAAIAGNYEAVMPLPWRKRFGFRYVYEPAFIQQLGFSRPFPREGLDVVFKVFRYGDLLFNYLNEEVAVIMGSTKRTNLVLDLSPGYRAIASSYRKDLQHNLARAARQGLDVTECSIDTVIDLYRQLYHDRFSNVRERDYRRFSKLSHLLQADGNCIVRSVSDQKGEILSAGIFFTDSFRVYNIMNATTSAGREVEANPLLLDAVIRQFAGHAMFFDFEGSDIPGVKSFYEKFGSVNEPYYHLHFNKLPLPFNWLKR